MCERRFHQMKTTGVSTPYRPHAVRTPVRIHELVSQAPRPFDKIVLVRERIRVARYPFSSQAQRIHVSKR